MKKTNKKQAAAWVLSLLPLVMIAAVCRLPAEVPMHWDLDGAVDYGAKAQLWVIAATAPVLEAMFCFLPKIDPKNKNYDKFGDAYLGIQLVTLLFLAAMTGICIIEALRPGTVNVSGVVCLLVSLRPVDCHELEILPRREQEMTGKAERNNHTQTCVRQVYL